MATAPIPAAVRRACGVGEAISQQLAGKIKDAPGHPEEVTDRRSPG